MKQFNIIFALLITFNINAQEFHIATNGNDSNSGSSAQPWKTIQHAMEELEPGNTVYIHQGTYTNSLYLDVSGSEGQMITFENYEDDEVIIDGSNFSSSAILEMIDVHHIVIDGLTFRNLEKRDAIGILVEGASDNITIKNCKIYNINFSDNPGADVTEDTNSQPLIVYGTDANHAIVDLQILDNEIYNCRTGFSEALAINGNVDGFMVSGNKVHDISNIGIDIIGHEGTCNNEALDQARNGIIANNLTYNCTSPYATSAGIYVDGGKDLTIERNIVHSNQWGIEIGCENKGKTSSNIVVRNNFCYNNQTAGITIGGYDYPSGSGKVTDVTLVNNSFYGNDQEGDYSGEVYLSYNEDLTIANNIFYATNNPGVFVSTEDLNVISVNVKIENNNWFLKGQEGQGVFYFEKKEYGSLSEIENATAIFSNNVSKDPDFVSIGGNIDLHLKLSSSMINSGTESSSLNYGNKDIDNDDRILDGSIDLGADEFAEATTSISDIIRNNDKICYPNPVTDYLTFNSEKLGFIVAKIELYNLIGKLVSTQYPDSSTIDMNGLKAGIYLVSFYNESKIEHISKITKMDF